MDDEGFRRLALALPGVTESAHMGHPDFRCGGRVIATLGYPEAGHAMVVLAGAQQEIVVAGAPGVFRPAAGAWGKRGSTVVTLAEADEPTIRSALHMAWSNRQPASK